MAKLSTRVYPLIILAILFLFTFFFSANYTEADDNNNNGLCEIPGTIEEAISLGVSLNTLAQATGSTNSDCVTFLINMTDELNQAADQNEARSSALANLAKVYVRQDEIPTIGQTYARDYFVTISLRQICGLDANCVKHFVDTYVESPKDHPIFCDFGADAVNANFRGWFQEGFPNGLPLLCDQIIGRSTFGRNLVVFAEKYETFDVPSGIEWRFQYGELDTNPRIYETE